MATPDYVVPVKVWLSRASARALFQRADAEHTTVSALLAQLADGTIATATEQPPKRPRYARLTDAELAEARRLRDEGRSVASIAEQLGITRQTLQARLQPKAER